MNKKTKDNQELATSTLNLDETNDIESSVSVTEEQNYSVEEERDETRSYSSFSASGDASSLEEDAPRRRGAVAVQGIDASLASSQEGTDMPELPNVTSMEATTAEDLEDAVVSSMVDSLLGSVVQNRIRRLAKSVIMNSFEFLVALGSIYYALVQSSLDHNEKETAKAKKACLGYNDTYCGSMDDLGTCEENPVMKTRLVGNLTVICNTTNQGRKECDVDTVMASPLAFTLFVLLVIYAIAVSIITFLRARRLAPRSRTRADVEQAYARTNNWPFIDGLLEIGLTCKFVGCRLPCFLWGFNALFIAFTLVSWGLVGKTDQAVETAETDTLFFSSLLAAVQMYRITSDVSEFLVLTSQTILDDPDGSDVKDDDS